MNRVEKNLEDFYNNYDEDGRLVRDKTHTIEFITTTKFVDKYLKKGDRILEVGAGTGRYTIHYASKGFKVDAVELVKKNLDILKSKITKETDVTAIQGNCLDLSMYDDNTFDITLILGPLYHLYTEKDAKKAIDEAIRVTKKNGKIIIAYITDDAVVLSYGVRKGNLKRLPEMCDENWKLEKREEEIFASYRVEDFDRLISNFNIQKLETIAADGIAPQMQEYVNNLDEEEFALFVDYHLKNCMRKDLMGYSSHILEIVEKR